MITQPGIYEIPADDYHADPCPAPSLSSSLAKVLLARSPLHARMMHQKLNPTYVADESSRFDLGTMAHAMLLEGDDSLLVEIDADDWRTKAAKESRDAARAAGKLPLLSKQISPLKAMVAQARTFMANCELSEFTFEAERTVAWTEHGIWCRSRPDWLSTDREVVLDYKTTDDANPEAFIRQIGRMSYDLQAEFYNRGIRAVCEADPLFVFLAQEVEQPYACSLVALSNAYIEIARAKVDRAIKTWSYCARNNDWPAYSNRILYAEPPAWAMSLHERALLDESGEWQ